MIKKGREWKNLIHEDSHQYFTPKLENEKYYEMQGVTYTKNNDITIFNFKEVDE